jgi:nitrogen fixation NifU-like protein
MAYSDKVLDHYENPRNVGTLDKNDPHVGTGMVGAPACGDVMKLQIKVNDSGIIEDAKFKTYGCGSAIASSSLVTEWLKGKTLDQAAEIKNSAIAEELALPPVKIHCSVLAEDAIKAAVADLKSKQPAEDMALTLTEVAAQRVEKFLNNRGKGIGLRLGVKTTGCSGMAYTLEFVDEMHPEDTAFESHGVKVIVDPKSLVYIDGTELDFTKEGLNEGFKFNNPNVKDECGCGESFTV